MWAFVFLSMIKDVVLQRSPYELNPDGTAKDPHVFRMALQKDTWYMNMLKKDFPKWYYAVMSNDDELLDDFLIQMYEARNGRPGEQYESKGMLQGLFEVKYDDGTIGDMAMLNPTWTEEEANHTKPLPKHMHCDACRAIAYQSNRYGRKALKGLEIPKRQAKLIETIQSVCGNKTMWAHDYGVQAGKSGINLLVGPGIEKKKDSYEGMKEVNVQTMHSGLWGARLEQKCGEWYQKSGIRGPELVVALSGNGKEGLPTFNKLLCDRFGGPCNPKPVKYKKLPPPTTTTTPRPWTKQELKERRAKREAEQKAKEEELEAKGEEEEEAQPIHWPGKITRRPYTPPTREPEEPMEKDPYAHLSNKPTKPTKPADL